MKRKTRNQVIRFFTGFANSDYVDVPTLLHATLKYLSSTYILSDISSPSKEIYSAFKSKHSIYFILNAWNDTMDFVLSALNAITTHSPYIRLLIDWVQMVKANIQIFNMKIQIFVRKPYWNVVVFWSTIIEILQYYLENNVPICLLMDYNSYTQSFNNTTPKANVIQFLLSTFDQFKMEEFDKNKKINIYVANQGHHPNSNQPPNTNYNYANNSNNGNNWRRRNNDNRNNRNKPNESARRPNYNRPNDNTAGQQKTNSYYESKDNLRLLRRTTFDCVSEYGTSCPSDICIFKFGFGACSNPRGLCGTGPQARFRHKCAFHPDQDHPFKALCECVTMFLHSSINNLYHSYHE